MAIVSCARNDTFSRLISLLLLILAWFWMVVEEVVSYDDDVTIVWVGGRTNRRERESYWKRCVISGNSWGMTGTFNYQALIKFQHRSTDQLDVCRATPSSDKSVSFVTVPLLCPFSAKNPIALILIETVIRLRRRRTCRRSTRKGILPRLWIVLIF